MALIGQPAGGGAGATPAPGWAGVSTVTLRELSEKHDLTAVRRCDSHVLVLVTVGHGQHEIDFRTYPCRPGTLLWVRPGQVIRFGGNAGLDAIVVCWEPAAVAEVADDPALLDGGLGPAYWQLAGEDEDAVINEVSQLVVDCQRHKSGTLAAGLLRHQLAVLLLRIALLPGRAPAERNDAYVRFRLEVEKDFTQTRRVEEYAERMGYSVRTVTRACLAATGRSAKQVIDDRVTLEAMRLLAVTEDPIADIGRRLGFPEPTNFGRFFHREAGTSPGAFRAAQRSGPRGVLPTQRRGSPADLHGRPAPRIAGEA
ncbi:AraC family transcriptional regulator [Asanoa sp. WMMD1127]|uniref:helix-turn-helix domain-containing protein n=1 Tax=Asanoa sp. WMMD1127 TaxID=3016107 RepID=UPI002417CA8F|nr:AraC family transcriptional regulator [Asanoa sp. WMMD1127]MDG4824079.1 AraC family transcriptional regulator [Asanoa sp. WMMD1127]